jgi:hypothetical protein
VAQAVSFVCRLHILQDLSLRADEAGEIIEHQVGKPINCQLLSNDGISRRNSVIAVSGVSLIACPLKAFVSPFLEVAGGWSDFGKLGENRQTTGWPVTRPLKDKTVASYNESIRVCVENSDNGSRDLFVKLLKDEEGHVDWLESQVHQIREIGYERYLITQTEEN